ncbi:MAG: hypothetical protein VB115_14320 [Christensenellaceae bacterium]|nr:hypothetical protein [Christensenellaceae bacterium]
MNREEKLKRILEDPVLFIKHLMRIVDKNQKVVPFDLTPQQIDLIRTIQDNKYSIVLKARQLGCSVACFAYSLWIATTIPNSTCLLMAQSTDGVTGIFGKLKMLYSHMADGIRPALAANNKSELRFANGSRIVAFVCGRRESSRGLSVNFCHISEAALCENTLEKQMLAIEQCLTPNARLVMESTAQGIGNYFSETYFKAERGENLYTHKFYPWHEDRYMFAEEHVKFAERYIAVHDHLPTDDELDDKEISLKARGATPEMLAWRRLKIANSSEQLFAQEFPSIPLEAFVTTGSNVFDPEILTEHLVAKANTTSTHLKHIEGLPDVLKPWLNRGLTIWRLPEPEVRFYLGCDASEGVGQDASTIEIIARDDRPDGINGMQCAEFRSNKIKPYQLTEVIHALALYYNRGMICCEKASGGHVVLSTLINTKHYRNLFAQREYDKGKQIMRPGFTTSSKTKPEIVGGLVEAFELGQVCINSEELLKEMKLFTADSSGKTGAKRGSHDDLVIAFCLALHASKSRHYYK